MSVRIYALARDQNIPSKDVVDACAMLGIEVKSHMSAISEEDATRVLQTIKNRSARPAAGAAPGSGPAAASPARPTPIRREDYIPASGVSAKVPDLDKPAKSVEDDKKQTAAAASKTKPRPLPKMGTAPAPVLRPVVPPKPQPAAPEQPKAQKPVMPLRGAMKDRPAAPPSPPAAPAAEAKPAPKPTPPPAPAPAAPKVEGPDKRPVKAKPTRVAEEEDEKLVPSHRAGAVAGREDRQKKRGRRAVERRAETEEDDFTTVLTETEEEPAPEAPRRARARKRAAAPAGTALERPRHLVLESPVTVRSLSHVSGIRANEILRKLLGMNVVVTINATLEDDVAQMLAMELGLEVELKKAPDAEQQLFAQFAADQPEDLESRPPVVTFMGHVDHGKTSLLDSLRQSNVVASESGGITQHIGAYQVEHNAKRVTFLDTPGHEAFTSMRARGAQVTDVVVLVVAADDGMMPQTEEAISHARAAGVPIVVAVNKVDLPNANVHRVMQQLANQGLLAAQWGGDVEFVETSALARRGLDQLLETLTVVAELRDLKTNPNKPAVGTCLEASLHEHRGVLATVLVQEGTLRRGDLILCGQGYGRVKAMFDDHDRTIREAGPSTPVVISGLDVVPAAGDRFLVTEDLDVARLIAEQRRNRQRAETLAQSRHITLETFLSRVSEEKVKELRLIIRADVRGSIEAITKELGKLQHPEVTLRVLHASVGAITESDVLLADASDAVIVGFQVVPDERARALAEQTGVEIRRYDIIYQLTEDIRKSLEGMLKPELTEVELGRALVQQVFKLSRFGIVAGCRVLQGVVERTGKVRLIRDGRIIYPEPGSGKEASIQSLRRVKEDVREVREGFECGIKIAAYDDVKEGDVIEVYKIEQTQRTL
ncbi:MAG: translation initiation factor IF-2 [Planctomycetes bacterium]|nr:translation initiation factor IF-2 [Planctomycetota bacterium]